MASKSAIANIALQAEQDLASALRRMSEVLGVDPARFAGITYPRDPDYQRAMQLKALSEWAWALSAELDLALLDSAKSAEETLVSHEPEISAENPPSTGAAESGKEAEEHLDGSNEDDLDPGGQGEAPDPESETSQGEDDLDEESSDDEPAESDEAPDLDHMSKAELIALAASYGLDVDPSMRKSDLINAIYQVE